MGIFMGRPDPGRSVASPQVETRFNAGQGCDEFRSITAESPLLGKVLPLSAFINVNLRSYILGGDRGSQNSFPVSRLCGSILPMRSSDSQPAATPRGPGSFRTTHWSLVRAAGGTPSEAAAQALEILCQAYWFPVYAHVRRRGFSPEEAQDLTQGFFAELLSKNRLQKADESRGRFRSFLLASVNHFLSHEREKQQAQKRGHGQGVISLDGVDPEEQFRLEPAAPETPPEILFDRRWARTLLDRVLSALRSEFDVAGQIKRFDVLKAFLLGDRGDLPLAEAAGQLGLTEAAVKSAVHRLRLRFRELFRAEIAETIEHPSDVEEEMRHLLRSLREG